MPTQPDQFPKIAATKAESPEVARLFADLAHRAERFAQMQDHLLESITKNREAREGRPVRLTKSAKRLLASYDVDADKAALNLKRQVAQMDDVALLTCALSCVRQQIRLDEALFPGFHEEDRPTAQRLLDYQRETLGLILQFIEASPFKGRVTSLCPGSKDCQTR